MFDYKKLFSRFYPSGFLILCGLILIIYGGLGVMYVQQGVKQKDLNKQITQLNLIVSKPLSSISELKETYNQILENLKPIDNKQAIELLVSVAERNGIEISEEARKFLVPASVTQSEKVGINNYRVLVFSNILVQGNYENVLAFITDLETNPDLKNVIVTGIVSSEENVVATGDEAQRREEFRDVKQAVLEMMEDNQLSYIYHPVNVAGKRATNYMGDNPNTESVQEGFPDAITSLKQKGYTGNATPKTGYLLYRHDRISTDNTSSYTTVNYFGTLTTRYYYTCESNGEVRQWDRADITAATEYTSSDPSMQELKLVLSLKIYTKA
jgi:hypothetical protein